MVSESPERCSSRTGSIRAVRASAWRRSPFLTHYALPTHHDGDQNRRDSSRTECSDLDRSRTDVREAILQFREFRPQNQTRLTAAFYANVVAPATDIPNSDNYCCNPRRLGRWARACLDSARKLIPKQPRQHQAASPTPSISSSSAWSYLQSKEPVMAIRPVGRSNNFRRRHHDFFTVT
jgi:hypothetical protein